jgi:hypothetical protein
VLNLAQRLRQGETLEENKFDLVAYLLPVEMLRPFLATVARMDGGSLMSALRWKVILRAHAPVAN